MNKKRILFKITEVVLIGILFILLSFYIDDNVYLSYIFLLILAIDFFVQKVIEKKYK